MAAFSKQLAHAWPTNLWVATSITTQKSTSRIKHLLDVGGSDTMRFLSVEPQWEAIDVQDWLPEIDWVIQGGESGADAHPFHVEWAKSLIGQCRESEVPYFLKQLGSNVCWRGAKARYEHNHAGNWDEWPADLRVRQFPELEAI